MPSASFLFRSHRAGAAAMVSANSIRLFFEGASQLNGPSKRNGEAPSPAYVSEFLATSDGLALSKAFMRIKEIRVRRRIVELVEELAGVNLN
jgi:hypothetical protein